MRERAVALVIACVVTSSGLQALAGESSEDPAQLFTQGQAAFKKKNFREAAELFERANRIRPAAQASYNAALAWDEANEPAAAANAFAHALDVGKLSADQTREASRRLLELSVALGKITIDEPSGARATVGEASFDVPGRLFVNPGAHTVVCQTQVGEHSHEVSLRAGQSLSLSCVPKQEPTITKGAPPPKRAPVQRRPEPKSSSGATKTLGYVGLGLGAAALGVGIYLNVRGLDANGKFEDSNRTDLDARDSAVGLRTGAFVSYGVAAVLGGVGTILLLSADDSGPQVGLGPGSVSTRVTF
ncbi:MAG: tetratricopeptide repeat protein [Polyangiaceae bacterium]